MLVEVWDMLCKHIHPVVQLKSNQSSGRRLPGKPKAGGGLSRGRGRVGTPVKLSGPDAALSIEGSETYCRV